MSTPTQVKDVNSKYRAMRRAQAHRAYWRHKNKYYLEQGYHLVHTVLGKGNSEGDEYRSEISFGGKTIKVVGGWDR